MRDFYANMHFHSTHSDGVYTPEELVSRGAEEGYSALVLADHEVATGVPALMEACAARGMDSMVGTEFYAVDFGFCFHILGYDFDPSYHEMACMQRYLAQKASFLAREQFDYCIAKGTITGITWEDVCRANEGIEWMNNEAVYRTLAQRQMITKKEYPNFFRHFIEYSPKYNPYQTPSAKTIISLIRDAGGIPVLAHPHRQFQYIQPLLDMGLMGLECSHWQVLPEEETELRNIARQHRLYTTGGTDHAGYMGGNEDRFPEEDGYRLPMRAYGATREEFETLKQRLLG